jgi:hypothetical protein
MSIDMSNIDLSNCKDSCIHEVIYNHPLLTNLLNLKHPSCQRRRWIPSEDYLFGTGLHPNNLEACGLRNLEVKVALHPC